jgi:hypothetical protein
VTPTWTAAQEKPACNSKVTVQDPQTLVFTWSASGKTQQPLRDPAHVADMPASLKWQEAARRFINARPL